MTQPVFDIYAEYRADTPDGLEHLHKDSAVQADWRINLLASALANEKVKEKGRILYRDYVYKPKGGSPYEVETLRPALSMLENLGLDKPAPFRPTGLPTGSWMVQFRFTLAKPYISRDDEAFYVIENPVRKDKAFKVPICSGTSWKGNLRWTAMKCMVDRHAVPNPDHQFGFSVPADCAAEFAAERFQLARLFGDEKGEEPGDARDVAKYLDSMSDKAAELYRSQVKKHFGLNEKHPMPHHQGRLLFCPTFFDKIGLEVINPHDRSRRVGTQPIYFESVPIGAKGTFSLLYVAFDVLGKARDQIEAQVKSDLFIMAGALREMFLTYGFSAKKSSGFGVAESQIDHGQLHAKWLDGPKALTSLQSLPEDVKHA